MAIPNVQIGPRITISNSKEMNSFDSLSPEVRVILREAWFPFSAFGLKKQGLGTSPTVVNRMISKLQYKLSNEDNLMLRPEK